MGALVKGYFHRETEMLESVASLAHHWGNGGMLSQVELNQESCLPRGLPFSFPFPWALAAVAAEGSSSAGSHLEEGDGSPGFSRWSSPSSCFCRAEPVGWVMSFFHPICVFLIDCSGQKQSLLAWGMHSAVSHGSASPDRPSESGPRPAVCPEGRARPACFGCPQNGVWVATGWPCSGHRLLGRAGGGQETTCLGFPSHPGSYKCTLGCGGGARAVPAHGCYLKSHLIDVISTFWERSVTVTLLFPKQGPKFSLPVFGEKQRKRSLMTVSSLSTGACVSISHLHPSFLFSSCSVYFLVVIGCERCASILIILPQ